MRIVILANNDIGLFKFRKELICELVKKHEVFICLPNGDYISELEALGCKFINCKYLDRHGMNPFQELNLLFFYFTLIMKYRPNMVLTYTIKPNVYGGLACGVMGVPYVANITGLGTAVENKGILQKITIFLYRMGLRKAQKVFFQNNYDKEYMQIKGIVKQNIDVLPGSGVNLYEYHLMEYPQNEEVHFLFIARVMKEKGIEQYIDAARYIRKKYPYTRFHVCGACEQDYRYELEKNEKEGILEYHGLVNDMLNLQEISSCTIHPTYYPEGLSNVLLESCACGRVIITTSRPGCKELVEEGVNGYLVNEKDSDDLINKIESFLHLSWENKKKMGLAGRRLVEKYYDRQIVVEKYLKEISKVESVIMNSKKLFFWTNYYIEHPEIGTTSKIYSEINTLRKKGIDVYYTAYLEYGVAVFNNNDERVAYKELKGNMSSVLFRIKRKNELIELAYRFLKENRFDLCLLRLNVLNHKYIKMLKEMKKNAFVMMESLSYFPNMKFSDGKGKGYYLILASLKWHRFSLKKYVDLMLTEGEISSFYGIPCVEFGMGVDVKRFKEHEYTGEKNNLNMLMVGCASDYHGTDRIIKSLISYYKTNDVHDVNLHLVGDILEDDQKLIRESDIKDSIIVYGRKYGADLEQIYDRCNIALGPLAQHRMKKKDTGLKTKEYFAKGIPYVYSGHEVLIEDDYPYIFQVEDSEELIDIEEIKRFYNSIKDNENLACEMREKARNVFSWDKIFDRVFDRIEEVKNDGY